MTDTPAAISPRLLGLPRPNAGTLAAVEAEIGTAFEPAEALALARDEVLAWLADTRGVTLPDNVWDGEGFREIDADTSIEVIVSTRPDAWLFRMRDGKAGDHQSILDLALAEDGGRIVLLVQSAWSAMAGQRVPLPVLPEPVRRIATRVGLSADGRALLPTAWRLRDSADLQTLIALMDSPARRLPLILLSEMTAEGGGALVDPDRAADTLLGLAHVVAIPFALAQDLTRLVSKEWSVFSGAARVYRPDLDRYAGAYRRHPLLLPATFPGEQGAEEALVALLRLAAAAGQARASVRIALSELHGRLTGSGLAGRLAGAASDAERIDLLQAEVRRLSLRIEEALGAAVAEESRVRGLDIAAEASALEAQALRSRLRKVTHALRKTGQLDALDGEGGASHGGRHQAARFAELYAERIDFTPAALKAMNDVVDSGLLRIALDAIADEYVPAQRAERPITQFRPFTEQRGVLLRGDTVLTPKVSASGSALRIAVGWDPLAETAIVSEIAAIAESPPA